MIILCLIKNIRLGFGLISQKLIDIMIKKLWKITNVLI